MPDVSTGTTMIKFGSSLRIGYRAEGSASAFTYLPQYYSQAQLPLTFTVPSSGSWEIEYSEICPNCSGGIYSDSVITIVNV
ncbi:hypothetical protein SAMN05428988_3222 [Chitinophaga sp. YR573]|nr:hypothetical protein SAMN05428988_3222 [Chitinophaga sp. YR573]